jgi:hypothetical protein
MLQKNRERGKMNGNAAKTCEKWRRKRKKMVEKVVKAVGKKERGIVCNGIFRSYMQWLC